MDVQCPVGATLIRARAEPCSGVNRGADRCAKAHRPPSPYQPRPLRARTQPSPAKMRTVTSCTRSGPPTGSVGGGEPVLAHADAHLERHRERVRGAHPLGDELAQPLLLALGDVEHELVVHLEQHP